MESKSKRGPENEEDEGRKKVRLDVLLDAAQELDEPVLSSAVVYQFLVFVEPWIYEGGDWNAFGSKHALCLPRAPDRPFAETERVRLILCDDETYQSMVLHSSSDDVKSPLDAMVKNAGRIQTLSDGSRVVVCNFTPWNLHERTVSRGPDTYKENPGPILLGAFELEQMMGWHRGHLPRPPRPMPTRPLTSDAEIDEYKQSLPLQQRRAVHPLPRRVFGVSGQSSFLMHILSHEWLYSPPVLDAVRAPDTDNKMHSFLWAVFHPGFSQFMIRMKTMNMRSMYEMLRSLWWECAAWVLRDPEYLPSQYTGALNAGTRVPSFTDPRLTFRNWFAANNRAPPARNYLAWMFDANNPKCSGTTSIPLELQE